jgi:uncharacterized membrane protein
MIQEPLALFSFFCAIVLLARWLEARFAFVQKISSAVVCTLLGIVLSNAGVIPSDSPVHAGILTYAVPYAIVLVVISSNLRELRFAGARMMGAFGFATLGAFAGGVMGGILFASLVGPETWKLAGAFSGSFVGGGMNFIAVGRGLQTEDSIFAAASVADNLSTVPFMLTQIWLFGVLARYYPQAPPSDPQAPRGPSSDEVRARWTEGTLGIADLTALVGLPLFSMYVARQLAPLIPGFPDVLWLTTFAIVLAQLPIVQKIRGGAMVSYFAMHLFFIVFGAKSLLSEVVRSGPMLFAFMLAIIAIQAGIAYGLGRLFRLDLPTISIAAQAAVGGPGSALPFALTMKWAHLATPGVIAGIFGYAVGNYVGFGVAYAVRWFVGS